MQGEQQRKVASNDANSNLGRERHQLGGQLHYVAVLFHCFVQLVIN